MQGSHPSRANPRLGLALVPMLRASASPVVPSRSGMQRKMLDHRRLRGDERRARPVVDAHVAHRPALRAGVRVRVPPNPNPGQPPAPGAQHALTRAAFSNMLGSLKLRSSEAAPSLAGSRASNRAFAPTINHGGWRFSPHPARRIRGVGPLRRGSLRREPSATREHRSDGRGGAVLAVGAIGNTVFDSVWTWASFSLALAGMAGVYGFELIPAEWPCGSTMVESGLPPVTPHHAPSGAESKRWASARSVPTIPSASRNDFWSVYPSHASSAPWRLDSQMSPRRRCCKAPTARTAAVADDAPLKVRGIHLGGEAAQRHECGEQDEC